MGKTLQIETNRLVLSVPGPEAAQAITAFVVENRAHLAPWEPVRDEGYFTERYWRDHLQASSPGDEEPSVLPFVLRDKTPADDGPIAGRCTFSQIFRGAFQAAYLGFGLDHRFVGRGLMEEALRGAIAYCFRELNLHRIMANYIPSNERSARLLNRLGFVREGYARDYLLIAGRWQDHVLTALTNRDWIESPRAGGGVMV